METIVPFSQETISIDVRCHQDLILRTTVNRRGKKISFAAHKKYKGFKGEITINLPRFCVLEEEDIYLEIIPEEIITYYNDYCHKQIESEKVITPVLHIERNNGAPFLRCVVVSLPLVSNVSQELLSSRIKTLNHNIELDAPSKQIRIRTTKFSEAGVKFSELSKCLDALAMNDDFSLKYTDLGVYFMVEQLPELEFRFDLRKFQNWQEHRRFRMDPTKFYCLLLNPQRVQTGDYGKWIKTSIPGQLEMFFFSYAVFIWTFSIFFVDCNAYFGNMLEKNFLGSYLKLIFINSNYSLFLPGSKFASINFNDEFFN